MITTEIQNNQMVCDISELKELKLATGDHIIQMPQSIPTQDSDIIVFPTMEIDGQCIINLRYKEVYILDNRNDEIIPVRGVFLDQLLLWLNFDYKITEFNLKRANDLITYLSVI